MLTPRTRRRKALNVIRVLLADGGLTAAGIHRELERQGLAPESRSTTHQWVQHITDEMAQDDTDPWTLPADATRRPDIVLAVLGARYRRYAQQRGGLPAVPLAVTIAQADMCVRLAAAAPGFLPLPTDDPATSDSVLLDLWGWALAYVGATGNTQAIREHDATIARFIAAGSPPTDGRDRAVWGAWVIHSAAAGAFFTGDEEPMIESVLDEDR